MRVLVTGAAGFLGGRVTEHLAASGHSVRALSRREAAASAERPADPAVGDVRDERAMRAATTGMDAIVHCAAAMNPVTGDMWDTNVGGVETLLRACLANGVSRFVHVSSVSVYRRPMGAVVAEDAPIGGVESYGWSKAAAEERVLRHSDGAMEAVILRPCQIYGAGDRSGFTQRLSALLARRVLPVCTGHEARFSIVHVDDAAAAAVAAATLPAAAGGTFNVAGPSQTSLRDLADRCAPARDNGRLLLPVPAPALRAGLILRWLAICLRDPHTRPWLRSYGPRSRHGSIWLGGPAYSTARAAESLGYRPRMQPEECLRTLGAVPG